MTKSEQSTSVPSADLRGTNVVVLPGKPSQERPSEKVIAFVKRHPVLTVAGGVAIGVAVSALIPRRKSRGFLNKAVHLVETAGAATAVLGKRVGERAHDVGTDARKQVSIFTRQAEKAGDAAIHNLEKYGLAALASAGTLGKATAKRTSRFADMAADAAQRISEEAAVRAHRLGETAHEGSNKVIHLASDLQKRVRSHR